MTRFIARAPALIAGLLLAVLQSSAGAATAACLHNMNDLAARYGKPVMLAEVGVPWNHPEGKAIIADLIAKVRQVDNGKGVGAFYWEPQAYNWKGYPMGAFDNSGKPTAIMDAFLE